MNDQMNNENIQEKEKVDLYGLGGTISQETLDRIEKEKQSIGVDSKNIGAAGCVLFILFVMVICLLLFIFTPKQNDSSRGEFERMINKVYETTKDWFINDKTGTLDYKIPNVKEGYLLVRNSKDEVTFDIAFEVNDGTWCAKKEFTNDKIAITKKEDNCDGLSLVALNNKEGKYITVNMVTGEISHPTVQDPVVDNARKGANVGVAYSYKDAVEKAMIREMTNSGNTFLKGTFDGTTYTGSDGVKTTLNVAGVKAYSVLLTIENGAINGGSFTINGYLFTVNQDGSITAQ